MKKVVLMGLSKEELVDKILEINKMIEGLSQKIDELTKRNDLLQGETTRLKKENNLQKEEIARLKKLPKKPDIKPNKLENVRPDGSTTRGGFKGKKGKELTPTEEITLHPDNIPEGATFHGYTTFTVQELVTEVRIIQYNLARYMTPTGETITAKLPASVDSYHFGPGLRQHIVYQSQANRVPQNKIHQELLQKGFQISEGTINNILADAGQDFKAEQQEMAKTGIMNSSYLQTDDTGARHAGKNGFCTFIGNEHFSFFKSTDSKSRINFLTMLRASISDYTLNAEAFLFIDNVLLQHRKKMPSTIQEVLEANKDKTFSDQAAWEQFLIDQNITSMHTSAFIIKLLTEAAMLGGLFMHGFNPNTIILSDAAGQFNLYRNALCWIHAMRTLDKLIPSNDQEREELNKVLALIKAYYVTLKEYSVAKSVDQTTELKNSLIKQFDLIFIKTEVNYAQLQDALINIYNLKARLLKVLDFPCVPLHNNGSERDIREYVTKRKISGGTRSAAGKDVRDVFTSLSKTCLKQEISFWDFLGDRIGKKNKIPRLATYVSAKAASSDRSAHSP